MPSLYPPLSNKINRLSRQKPGIKAALIPIMSNTAGNMAGNTAGNTVGKASASEEVVAMSKIETLDAFTRQYLETALWSSTDNTDESGGEPLDANYSLDDISDESLDAAIKDCANFQELNAEALAEAYASDVYIEGSRYDAGSAGHDFWLTRNDHGAGFWDRGLDEVGDVLSKASKPYGSVDLYVGDDGKIYGS